MCNYNGLGLENLSGVNDRAGMGASGGSIFAKVNGQGLGAIWLGVEQGRLYHWGGTEMELDIVIENHPFDATRIGDSATLTRLCTEEALLIFAAASSFYGAAMILAGLDPAAVAAGHFHARSGRGNLAGWEERCGWR